MRRLCFVAPLVCVERCGPFGGFGVLNVARRTALATALAALAARADACVVTDLVNLGYLTGFTGSNGALLVLADGTALLATDGRYAEQAAGEAPGLDIVVTRDVAGELVRRAAEGGAARVAIERQHVTLSAADRLAEAAGAAELVDLDRAVETLRVVKDVTEIDALRRA